MFEKSIIENEKNAKISRWSGILGMILDIKMELVLEKVLIFQILFFVNNATNVLKKPETQTEKLLLKIEFHEDPHLKLKWCGK